MAEDAPVRMWLWHPRADGTYPPYDEPTEERVFCIPPGTLWLSSTPDGPAVVLLGEEADARDAEAGDDPEWLAEE